MAVGVTRMRLFLTNIISLVAIIIPVVPILMEKIAVAVEVVATAHPIILTVYLVVDFKFRTFLYPISIGLLMGLNRFKKVRISA